MGKANKRAPLVEKRRQKQSYIYVGRESKANRYWEVEAREGKVRWIRGRQSKERLNPIAWVGRGRRGREKEKMCV